MLCPSENRRVVRLSALLALAAGGVFALSGCASSQQAGSATPADAPTRADAPATEQNDLASQIADDALALEQWFEEGAEQAREQASAQRDAERLGSEPPRLPAAAPETIVNDDAVATLPANAGVDPSEVAPEEMEVAIEIPEELATTPTPPAEPEPTLEQRIERLTTELAARLREQADTGERPLHALASIAALELIQPGIYDQPAAAALLTSRERDALGLWRDMLRYTGRTLQDNDSANGMLRAVAAANDQARDFEVLDLTKVALCARVDGFGQYDELPGSSMLAGKAHRVGLYVEVDGFGARSASDEDGRPAFRVELTRELSLYHDADGLLAWRRPAADINDISLNRRRDFFFSEVIELPQTLTVGSYRLKVAVTDRVTGAVAETILPINIVADARLTRTGFDD